MYAVQAQHRNCIIIGCGPCRLQTRGYVWRSSSLKFVSLSAGIELNVLYNTSTSVQQRSFQVWISSLPKTYERLSFIQKSLCHVRIPDGGTDAFCFRLKIVEKEGTVILSEWQGHLKIRILALSSPWATQCTACWSVLISNWICDMWSAPQRILTCILTAIYHLCTILLRDMKRGLIF